MVSGFKIASDFSLGLPEIRDISKFKSRKFGDKAGTKEDTNSTAGGDI